MSGVEIDREMLESFSSSEIKRILREDYDDYTPEALEIFRDILEARGDDGQAPSFVSSAATTASGQAQKNYVSQNLPIYNPKDAVNFLNDLLEGVMSDRIDNAKAGVSVTIVMAILKAHEAAMMMESDED